MHLYDYPSYKTLAKAYNKEFGTNIAETTIGTHVKHDMGVTKPRMTGEYLTEEQKAFIEDVYPKHSVKETTKMFNERFGTSRTKATMRNYAQRHGLKVDERVATQSKLAAVRAEGSKRAERKIGDVRFDGRYWVIKTEEGWKTANRAVWGEHYGKVQEGCAVIHLDGDPSNYSIENLMEVPIRHLGLLDVNGLRSENAEITKTGVIWCELYDALEGEKK